MDSQKETTKHKYEIYDRKSGNLLAKGFLKERNGAYVAEMLVPDSEDALVLVEGKVMQLRPSIPIRRPKPELVDDDQITEMYWSYGDECKPLKEQIDIGDELVWKSKHNDDLNLHVVTEDGNDGKMVEITLENENGQKIDLHGMVSDNMVVFEKILLLNLGES